MSDGQLRAADSGLSAGGDEDDSLREFERFERFVQLEMDAPRCTGSGSIMYSYNLRWTHRGAQGVAVSCIRTT